MLCIKNAIKNRGHRSRFCTTWITLLERLSLPDLGLQKEALEILKKKHLLSNLLEMLNKVDPKLTF